MRVKTWLWIVLLALGVGLLWQLYPTLLFKVSEWQRQSNLELSGALNRLQQHQHEAGMSLVAVSFLYGVFHAVGPGHGKFILSGYLSFEQARLPQAIRLTLLSALVQGIVAVALVSVIVGLFTLSRSQFNLTLKWVERGSFVMMILLGSYWIYQSRGLFGGKNKRAKMPKILQITPLNRPLAPVKMVHQHSESCGCGHQHLPTNQALTQARSLKSQWLLVLGIGLRPCSGAVLVLFLAYMLDLYVWGVVSALVMALGTGLSLTLFALLVLFARQKALNIGRWYLSASHYQAVGKWLKLAVGVVIILFALMLLHSSWLDNSQNLLFKR